MNKRRLKFEAGELCRSAKPSLILMGLIFTALSILSASLSTSVLATNITEEGAQRYLYAFSEGNMERAIELATNLQPSTTGYLISALLTVVMWIVTAGFVMFVMNTVRRNGAASFGNILDGFGITLRVLLLNILTGLFTGLLMLLLIVPGVIFAYGWRQSMFLMIDRPDLSVLQCMKESRRMMKGHKWELFTLDLSFIGWHLLSAILPVVKIWVTPYTKTAYVMYYEQLCGNKAEEF